MLPDQYWSILIQKLTFHIKIFVEVATYKYCFYLEFFASINSPYYIQDQVYWNNFICFFYSIWLHQSLRRSRPEVFLRKGVLKICSKFAGEYPCRSVISIKLLCNFTEITPGHECFPVNSLHIFGTSFYINTYGGLLLVSLPLLMDHSIWLPLQFLTKTIFFVWMGFLSTLEKRVNFHFILDYFWFSDQYFWKYLYLIFTYIMCFVNYIIYRNNSNFANAQCLLYHIMGIVAHFGLYLKFVSKTYLKF